MTFHSRAIQHPGLPFPNMRAFGDVGPMPRTCQWPLWDDQERATHVYCGKATVTGRVYCHEHCTRAYLNAPPPPPVRWLLKERADDEVPRPPPVPALTFNKVQEKKSRAEQKKRKASLAARQRIENGAAPFVRVKPEIDPRLCINEREQLILTLWNQQKTQRDIGTMLGISHNAVAGCIARIRARRLER